MKLILNKLRIVEKIALGFGLVGLIFLTVIWLYHSTLKQSLEDYQFLNDNYASKKNLVMDIEIALLKARQSEKDFLLKRNLDDSNKVVTLIQHSLKTVEKLSTIDSSASESAQQFNKNLQNYLNHFHLVKDAWVKKGLDENSGLQGSFRDAVHALEDIVTQLNNDKIHVNLLQLRRREKDYLLRGDNKYVELALNTIQVIQQQLESSQFSAGDKTRFISLLINYQRDFSALVEQNNHITVVVNKMQKVAVNVSQLVNKDVVAHNKAMLEMSRQINNSSDERINLMFWLVLIALALGVYFAVSITSRIVSPLRKMAIILENLTYTELIEVMPYQPGGRDEVNAMAGSLNILADHRKRFIQWWENAMDEAESYAQLEKVLIQLSEKKSDSTNELESIKSELIQLLAEKKNLLSNEYQLIRKYNTEILNQAALIDHPSIPRDDMYKAASSIHYNASLIQKTLGMLSSGHR
jgi:methyl-accepting chemotaxis protein